MSLGTKIVFAWLAFAALWVRGYFIYKSRRVPTLFCSLIVEVAGYCVVVASAWVTSEPWSTVCFALGVAMIFSGILLFAWTARNRAAELNRIGEEINRDQWIK
jgi:ABC-type nickel/cobalt efflux system permease component RcnA